MSMDPPATYDDTDNDNDQNNQVTMPTTTTTTDIDDDGNTHWTHGDFGMTTTATTTTKVDDDVVDDGHDDSVVVDDIVQSSLSSSPFCCVTLPTTTTTTRTPVVAAVGTEQQPQQDQPSQQPSLPIEDFDFNHPTAVMTSNMFRASTDKTVIESDDGDDDHDQQQQFTSASDSATAVGNNSKSTTMIDNSFPLPSSPTLSSSASDEVSTDASKSNIGVKNQHNNNNHTDKTVFFTPRTMIVIALLLCIGVVGIGFGVGWYLVGDTNSSNNSSSGSGTAGVTTTVTSNLTTPDSTPPLVVATEPPTGNPTNQPTKFPTNFPTNSPTDPPVEPFITQSPTVQPMTPPPTPSGPAPTVPPTPLPTNVPTVVPPTNPPTAVVALPTVLPLVTNPPTKEVQDVTSDTTTDGADSVSETENNSGQEEQEGDNENVERPTTYIPGNLTHIQEDLLLSEGLSARLIARSGEPVLYWNGTLSDTLFHILPDAGAAFADTRPNNIGGFIYVSNSEHRNQSLGGVGAITFDVNGNVIDYRMLLENTTMNCGGGRSPWNTWVSCEEVEFDGKIYQVDPTGQREPQLMTLGSAGGRWESFAYDVRNRDIPRFFATEDHNKGTVRRFTPDALHWGGDEWKMLHETGVTDYLIVQPNENLTGGTFQWTNDIEAARNNAREFYPQSEGIDVNGSKMFVVCKRIKQLFTFDLDEMTYVNRTTLSGLFDGSPDQMERIIEGEEGGLLYFTEEGGVDAGIHARDSQGRFFTILESPVYLDETTGLSFTPDGMYMFVAYQENGLLFQIWRDDGYPFNYKTLDVKYHSVGSRRLNSQWIKL